MMAASATTPLQRTPAKPFYFNTSAHLLRITKYKANTLAELLDALRECPEDSVFQHTFRTLQEHHFIREGFSNDFAHWTLAQCNEPSLAEVLASVDVREFTSLAALRERFIQILEKYLKGDPKVAARAADETFYFCASDIVVLPTSFEGRTMHEARLRLKLMSNDFSQWLHEDVGLTEAARKLNRIDIYTATLEDVRQQIVRIVERALT